MVCSGRKRAKGKRWGDLFFFCNKCKQHHAELKWTGKLTLRVSGASEVCFAPSWGLTTLSSWADAAVKAALLSDGGNGEIINCYSPVRMYVLECGCVYADTCVGIFVFWCLFVCVSDSNHSACADRGTRLCVSKHCVWIKGIWHSSIQSDSDVNMRQWLTDWHKTKSHSFTHART